jgi:hypothetical protein
MYTEGRSDDVPGIPPGQTPYLNLDDWSPGMTMGRPSALYENSYPGSFRSTWPIGEAYFNTPWVWAYSEFTPQQTMRGKTALYGYLYGLGGGVAPTNPLLVVTVNGTGSGTVTSSPVGIDCGSDCSEAYASGASVTLTATADADSHFTGWGGACSDGGPCTVTMTASQSVTATFDLGPCTPNCEGRVCGDDGCNGSCGLCAGDEECSALGTCVPAGTDPSAATSDMEGGCALGSGSGSSDAAPWVVLAVVGLRRRRRRARRPVSRAP